MSEQRLRVDIWSDIACPWCFIGKRRFESALQQLDFADQVDVHWHAFQLDPSLPEHYAGTELQYLSEVKGMPAEQVQGMLEHVTAQAAGEGLSYDFEKLRPANSFNALRLLQFAKQQGQGSAMKEALLSAHFERGLDTGDRETLADLAAAVGLDRSQALDVLETDAHADEVRADIDQARQLGISGVPFFVLEGKYGISGAQPAENFVQALRQVRAEQG
ncbi:DsbA family oxidoreductase [Glutamicibacter sp. V16R2B1]|uniref:DsbA family oxidoreductase n=1 Tax=Glutamicibacter sp. V16R2B1 TaxID=2036207 RepID=UPI0010FF5FDE|nr:DsbA family oxidoreductase [Glutamicibacter sp. V16R2B1]TLK54692.1 DsbA family oxidoreductase [Glutamicibacter sp. V16R2B1]